MVIPMPLQRIAHVQLDDFRDGYRGEFDRRWMKDTYRGDKTVSPPRQGLYETRILSRIPERLADLIDRRAEGLVKVSGRMLAPQQFLQFFPRDDLTGTLHQHAQDPKRLPLHLDFATRLPKLSALQVSLEQPEPDSRLSLSLADHAAPTSRKLTTQRYQLTRPALLDSAARGSSVDNSIQIAEKGTLDGLCAQNRKSMHSLLTIADCEVQCVWLRQPKRSGHRKMTGRPAFVASTRNCICT
jgi:hypothetical protein